MASITTNDLFSSLISDIKTYSGNDPLLPWLQGIRKMRDCLPPQLLKEKLPRFLQKCAQTFEADRRYRNDMRYLRVWLQLMDFVDDPKALLRTMEMASIGKKRSLFYLAYALYYEKVKKFEDAEKMYRLGVQNLAEPAVELQKSYEQFIHRMGQHKNKRIQRQEVGTTKRHLHRNMSRHCGQNKENNDNMRKVEIRSVRSFSNQESVKGKVLGNSACNEMPMKVFNHLGISVKKEAESWDSDITSKASIKKDVLENGPKGNLTRHGDVGTTLREPRSFRNDDTVAVKFVDTAIVGKSEAEDASHHGLVDPTINTKEAMNAINSMFQEPLETAVVDRRSHRNHSKVDHGPTNEFEVFDEDANNEADQKEERPQKASFERFIDNDGVYKGDQGHGLSCCKVLNSGDGSALTASHVKAFVFPNHRHQISKCSGGSDVEYSPPVQLGEDTVVCRFVGSTILDEAKVENACHHGLVEPTINLREAMDDINSMFGKPIDFVRATRPGKKGQEQRKRVDCGGFSILPDDDLKNVVPPNRDVGCGSFSILPDDDDDLHCQQAHPPPNSRHKSKECDLYEPTLFTKEAMDDINKMFGMPLDF